MPAPTPRRRRRPSKAAVLRALADKQATAQAPAPTLPENLAAIVDGFTSTTVPDALLPAVREFLTAVIAVSGLRGAESVRKHCRHLAGLAVYAHSRGLPLQATTVLTTVLIDEYVRLGMTGASDALRAERRRRLLAVARTVNPGPMTPARLTPIGHAAVQPCYTPDEMDRIKRVALGQHTPAKRRDLCAVVGLGAGAGLDSIDLRDLHVRDIAPLGDDDTDAAGWRVHVHGPRPRVVPVRAGCDRLIAVAVTGRPESDLVIGTKLDRRNTAARAVEGATAIGVPHIVPARLRATWLADVMTDTVPIGVILAAAGLKSARTLVDLLPHLDPWLDRKNLTIDPTDVLRGGAR